MTAAGSPSVISVVITAFEQAGTVRAAVLSALQQEGVEVEVVVVDDGSSDDPRAALHGLADVQVVRQQNAGVNAARNRGLSRARGDLIVFLDGDDALLPGSLRTSSQMVSREPDVHFVVGRALHIDNQDRVVGAAPHEPRGRTGLFEELLRRPWIYPPSTVLFRRSTLQSIGGFDEALPQGGEDLDLYLRVARRFAGRDHGQYVVAYRLAGRATSDGQKMLSRNLNVLERHRTEIADDVLLVAALEAGRRYLTWLWGSKMLAQEIRRQPLSAASATASLRLAVVLLRAPGLTSSAIIGRAKTALRRHARGSTPDGRLSRTSALTMWRPR